VLNVVIATPVYYFLDQFAITRSKGEGKTSANRKERKRQNAPYDQFDSTSLSRSLGPLHSNSSCKRLPLRLVPSISPKLVGKSLDPESAMFTNEDDHEPSEWKLIVEEDSSSPSSSPVGDSLLLSVESS